MKIELSNISHGIASDPVYQAQELSPGPTESVQSKANTPPADVTRVLDEATGLIQTIVTEKMSEDIIRKMPPDEYLQLLTLLDDIISGSIDKQV